MPAVSPTSLFHAIAETTKAAQVLQVAANSTNATTQAAKALQVICAWPVSGQYGFGSRLLYYVLVAACVLGRDVEWLRNATLAAALIFPAVAAIHAVVLAIMHIDGGVDMDIYGAFQLCSIGILAAPVTVRLSKTYFNDPGRNAIFLWTLLLLAGLASLAVEFYRTEATDCLDPETMLPITNMADFIYGVSNCSLTCDVDKGPFSPMRGGSANNIYVILSPDVLTFGTVTLLASACCIPAILSLVSTWNKILEIKWWSRFGVDETRVDDLIEGTNGATIAKMRKVNNVIGGYQSTVEIVVFTGFVLAILIFGERNFYSHSVNYMVEPMASVGQWAPIVGTGIAALGSAALIFSKDGKEIGNKPASLAHSDGSSPTPHNDGRRETLDGHPLEDIPTPPPPKAPASHRAIVAGETPDIGHDLSQAPTYPSSAAADSDQVGRTFSNRTASTYVENGVAGAIEGPSEPPSGESGDAGSRRTVARALNVLGNYFGNPSHDMFDDSEFRQGRAVDFPEIPGEEHRNPELDQIREAYNYPRNSEGQITPSLRRQGSRGSFASSISNVDLAGHSAPKEAAMPGPSAPSIVLSPLTTSGASLSRISTLPTKPSPIEVPRIQKRRDTLEVPSPSRHNPPRHSLSSFAPLYSLPQPSTQALPDTAGEAGPSTGPVARLPDSPT
ncbi:hypothetical protein GQ53DRAFT_752230 [Thozetella sp. PMI_491]|nr:hypothetical protein GQ53DRAFT_752230 [Thozetella sp. PMI_491]